MILILNRRNNVVDNLRKLEERDMCLSKPSEIAILPYSYSSGCCVRLINVDRNDVFCRFFKLADAATNSWKTTISTNIRS